MSKSALFNNNIDISGNLNVSGNLFLSDTLVLDASATINMHGLDIPPLPTDLCGQILIVDNSGTGLEWKKSDAVGESGTNNDANVSGFYEKACTDVSTSSSYNKNDGTSEFYSSLLTRLDIPT
jgi:hypothetical protein